MSVARPFGFVDWREIEGKGRGVVAMRAVRAGTEVERSPVKVVPLADLLVRDGARSVPEEYLLYWSDEPGRELAIGFGMLMLYNHSGTPNVELHTGPDPDTMSVIAVRDIAEGEELAYDYDVPLWFAPVGG